MQVGADLGSTGYLPHIVKATDDIDVQVLFCNAGYMLTGFFENRYFTCACKLQSALGPGTMRAWSAGR